MIHLSLICLWQIEQEKLASLKKVDEEKKEKDLRERAQSKSPRRYHYFHFETHRWNYSLSIVCRTCKPLVFASLARRKTRSPSPRRRSPSPRRRSPAKRERKRSPSRSPRRKQASPVGGSSPPPPLMQLSTKSSEEPVEPDTSGRAVPEAVVQEASSTWFVEFLLLFEVGI